MIDVSKLKTAQDWIEKLANGINPLTSEPVKEDDIVNNVHISRCLFFVSETLGKVDIVESVSNKKRRTFWMSARETEQIEILAPCGIALFTKTVNEHIPADMKPLSVAVVIRWLRNNGYLYEVSIDEKHKTNLPTEKGIQLGITVKVQQNTEGKDFQKVIYSISAQKFLLTNIESIAISR
ncbi:MAG: hypothetical protein J6Q48_09970 [Bacteroidaceae bacterium]|nr:hypothetical protein [Bacteroidaceae bacterium]